ncbi:cell division protein FtsL [Streptococcus caprae]|uniref:Cell division protein FtsL n=1 Tax=Streptococcus caprae TaxID=1640501 RepID=A0ABV8CXB4_9STRE
MKNEKRNDAIMTILQKRIRTFSRVEKAFYASLIGTAIIMAIAIIFLQSRILQVQQEMTDLNSEIAATQTELTNAKQEVNELTRLERVSKIATDAGLTNNNENIKKVE